MGQILKLKPGGQLLNEKLAELQSLYEGASDEVKHQIDILTENENNFLKTKQLQGSDEKKFRLEMAQRKIDLINNQKPPYNPVQTGTASTNVFGYVKGTGINTLANDLVRATFSSTGEEKPAQAATAEPGTGTLHFTYNWRNPQFDFMANNASVKDRVRLVAEGLLDQIGRLQSTNEQKGYIHNFDKNNLEYANGAVAQLQGILDKLNNEDYTDNQAFQDLTNIVGSGKLNVDADEYKRIFSEFWKEKTAAEKAGVKDVTGDYSGIARVDKELKRRNYKVYEKDGQRYIGDAEGNRITGYTYNYINDDYTLGDEGGYNQGFYVLGDGSVWSGDVRTLTNPEDPYYQAHKNYTSKDNANGIWVLNDNLYLEGKIDDDSYIKDDLLNQIQAKVGNGNWLDVSNYLEGDIPVIAVRTDGKEFQKTPYGTPIFINDPNVKLYTLDADGNLVDYTDVSTYRYRGYGEDLIDRPITQLDGSWRDEKDLPFTAHDHMSNKNWWTALWDSYKDAGDQLKRIEENPAEWIKEVLSAIYQLRVTNNQAGLTERQRKILHNFKLDSQASTEDFTKAVAATLQLIAGYKDDPAVAQYLKTPEASSALRQLKIAYNNGKNLNAQVMKYGGIIYARKGTVLEGQQVKEDKANAFDIMEQNRVEGSQHGYSDSSRWSVGNQELADEMKAEDWIRIGAIAADLVGIGTNFVPVYGSAISAGTGVASAAANLTADLMDESVGTGQVFKNLGINLGLAALNLVPGAGASAKTAKLLSQVSKWAPRILKMANYAGLALDEDTHKAWEKVLTGDFSKITRDDLKNIGWTMSTLAGGARSTRRKVIVNKGKADGNSIKQIAKMTPKGEKYYEITDANGKKYNVSKNVADQVQALAKEGKVDEANALLRSIPEIGKDATFNAQKEEETNKAFGVLRNIKNAAKKKFSRKKTEAPEKTTEGGSEKPAEVEKMFFPMKEKQEMGYNEGAVRNFLASQRVDKNGNPRRFMTDAERYMLQELGVSSGARMRGNSIDMFDKHVAAMKPATVLDITPPTPTPSPTPSPKPTPTPTPKPSPKPSPKTGKFTDDEKKMLGEKASETSKHTLNEEISAMLYDLRKDKAKRGKINDFAFRKAVIMERTKGKTVEEISKMMGDTKEFERLRAEYKFKRGGSLQRLQTFVNNN